MLEALLYDSNGPVAGERLEFSLQRGDEEENAFLSGDPITDASGRAVARLTLVNGRHGGQEFPAGEITPESQGEPYTVTIHFPGSLDANDPLCDITATDGGTQPADAGAPSGLCPSTNDVDLFVGLETVTLELEPGNRVALSDELVLLATLVDPNGDASVAGTDIDGTEPVPLADRTVSFYFDLDGNGSPSIDERLGNTQTDQTGLAAFNFFADPALIPAGDFEKGLHTQFGGDAYYGFAGGSARATIDPGPADATRTLISATPESAPANGASIITVEAILVDAAGNVLGVDAPDFSVSFETDLGTIQGDGAERDLLTGAYHQDLLAPREAGYATIQVIVDGEKGAEMDYLFSDAGGCSCDATSESKNPTALIFAFLMILFTTRFSRRGRRYGD